MKRELLELLRCPRTGQRLTLAEEAASAAGVEEGWLTTEDGAHRFRIAKSVPRFVPETNYADSFGLQWNKFSKTQPDSHSGQPISARRFWDATGWSPSELSGKWVLDLGCGAGRFAEIALRAGANVVAVDYSKAVDACQANLGDLSGLHVIQGDVYCLPFEKRRFDFVYSLGVLQHTPDVWRAFASLPGMLVPGGRLCVDFYHKTWKSLLLPKYWLRPLTTRIPTARLFAILQFLVPFLLPVSCLVSQIPLLGRHLKRLIPIANYAGELPLNARQQLEWSLLDTFDWLSPECDHPQTWTTVQEWLETVGMHHVQVLKAGHLVGRGTSPLH